MVPYFDSCKEWVESLPYGVHLYNYKGFELCHGEGYTWGNPYLSAVGKYPEYAYLNLFKSEPYYGLSEHELTELRTTIQYFKVYLDESFDKMVNMLKDLGFVVYRKEGKPGDLRHMYMRRGRISVYFSNITTPQDYAPNRYGWQWGWYKILKSCKEKRELLSHSELELQDDFGEKTKIWVEKYIKENLYPWI